MAHSKSARKRVRQTGKRTLRSRHYRGLIRTSRKKFTALLSQGKTDKAQTQLQETVGIIHRVARKGILHKNRAATTISRLHQQLHRAGAS